MRNVSLALLVLSCLGAGLARADFSTSLQIMPVKDNTIFSDSTAITDLSNGAGNFLFAGNTVAGTNFTRRALMAFDLSGVPPGAVITDASLRMRVTREGGGTVPSTFSLHRVAQDWGEGASAASGEEGRGARAEANDATWQHSFYDQAFWSVLGGDFLATPSAQLQIDGLGFYTFSGQGLIDDLQFFLAQPQANFGWLLRDTETEVFTARQFGSRNDTDIGPLLSLSYSIPEPGVLGLLLSGSLLLGLRAAYRATRSSA